MLFPFLSSVIAKFLLVSLVTPISAADLIYTFFYTLGNVMRFWVFTWVRILVMIVWVMTKGRLQIGCKHLGACKMLSALSHLVSLPVKEFVNVYVQAS